MASPKRLARIAGLLYLIVDIFGGFAIAYVSAKITFRVTRPPRLLTPMRTPGLFAWA